MDWRRSACRPHRLLALLRHPDQWARLGGDRSLMQDALRELLRYDSPVQYTARVASEDLTLLGQERSRPGMPSSC